MIELRACVRLLAEARGTSQSRPPGHPASVFRVFCVFCVSVCQLASLSLRPRASAGTALVKWRTWVQDARSCIWRYIRRGPALGCARACGTSDGRPKDPKDPKDLAVRARSACAPCSPLSRSVAVRVRRSKSQDPRIPGWVLRMPATRRRVRSHVPGAIECHPEGPGHPREPGPCSFDCRKWCVPSCSASAAAVSQSVSQWSLLLLAAVMLDAHTRLRWVRPGRAFLLDR